jgi:hypothetical protein
MFCRPQKGIHQVQCAVSEGPTQGTSRQRRRTSDTYLQKSFCCHTLFCRFPISSQSMGSPPSTDYSHAQSTPIFSDPPMLQLVPLSALMAAPDGTLDHPFNTIAAGDATFPKRIQKLTSSRPISSHNKLPSPRSLAKRIYGKPQKICCNYFNLRNHQQSAIHLSNSAHQC